MEVICNKANSSHCKSVCRGIRECDHRKVHIHKKGEDYDDYDDTCWLRGKSINVVCIPFKPNKKINSKVD